LLLLLYKYVDVSLLLLSTHNATVSLYVSNRWIARKDSYLMWCIVCQMGS